MHPDRIALVFEVPKTSTVRRVTVPQPIALSQEPVRISELGGGRRVVRRVPPHDPDAALRNGIEGLVKLDVLVRPDGTVAGARPIHGSPILSDAAAAAVRQWRYEPVVAGKPALVRVEVHFGGGR